MAFLEFYMDSATGNDFNSGTSSGSPVTITGATTSLPFIAVAGQVLRVTAASGTPFAAVSAGQWASVWTSAQTVSTAFIGQIYAVNGGGSSIDIYQENSQPGTNCFGQADSINGTGNGQFGAGNTVNVNVGGPWASLNSIVPSNNASGAFSGGGHGNPTVATATYNIRVNVKAGTYNSSGARTFPAGTAARPIWWRGYYSTPGDLDQAANVSGTFYTPSGSTIAGASRPQFTFSGAYGLTAGAFNWFDNIEVTSSGTAMTGGTISRFTRCRFTGTGSANVLSASGATLVGCVVSSSNGFTGWVGGGNAIGCVFRGTVGSGGVQGVGTLNLMFCVFENTGIVLGSQPNMIVNNAFYNCGNGISNTTSGNGTHLMANNIFANNRVYGINQSGMTNPAQAYLINNDFFGNTSGAVNNLFENYQVGAITTESATPFANAGSHDFSLVSGALARQAGFPGQFEV
jgi:hypothetical protein